MVATSMTLGTPSVCAESARHAEQHRNSVRQRSRCLREEEQDHPRRSPVGLEAAGENLPPSPPATLIGVSRAPFRNRQPRAPRNGQIRFVPYVTVGHSNPSASIQETGTNEHRSLQSQQAQSDLQQQRTFLLYSGLEGRFERQHDIRHTDLRAPLPTPPSTHPGVSVRHARTGSQDENTEHARMPVGNRVSISPPPADRPATAPGVAPAAVLANQNPNAQNIAPACSAHALPPLARRPYREHDITRHDLGRMDIECPFCHALHWAAERLTSSSATHPRFGLCCDSGQVNLPPCPDPPLALRNLYTGDSPQAREFRDNIRQYNAAFAFTSLGVEIDEAINQHSGRAPYVFRIHGELCHLSGALLPAEGRSPVFSQLYIFDPRMALQERTRRNSNLREDTLRRLQQMLLASHRYAQVYKHAYEVLSLHDDSADVSVRLVANTEHDRRRYNLPTADDVAVVLPGMGEPPAGSTGRDIILRRRAGPLQRISETHPAYSPLQYTLLFPFGTHGWHWDLRLEDGRRRLSQTRFYAYQIQVRHDEFSTVLRGGRLFQQYIVDMWASAEQSRLRYLRDHQSQLRAAVYSGLEDALRGGQDVSLSDLGQLIVLPSSFTASPRYMQQLFQDGMAIARYFHNIDLFLTMTANPRWPEIERELFPGQDPSDRPDLIARVFNLKKNALIREIIRDGIFGHAVAHIYTIEFQKRGLPHMHLLIFLDRRDKLLDPAAVDSAIRATWPDPDQEPLLFETVKARMVHGPCGVFNPSAPCMQDGRCTKHYPRSFQEHTSLNQDGYPLYRRPDDGRAYMVNRHMVDNRWIVPYNPYLLVRYNCHINVECSVTFASVKYVTKYIHKGHDRGTLEVHRRDEIKSYIDARYVSAPEAVWRTLHFDLHEQSPAVVRLQIHLPGQHLALYNPAEDPAVVLARAANERTMLTAFFEVCASDDLGPIARQYTYQEFPQFFVWQQRNKRWVLRQRGFALGRLYFVSPNAGERFYLRLLLTVVRGPTSFEALRTVNGEVYPSFYAACLARGLLQDDGEWRECLQEAAEMQTGTRLRYLFATLLQFCQPAQPDVLWHDFRHHICDDLRHRLSTLGRPNASEDEVYDYGLFLLDRVLREHGSSLLQYPSMPIPVRNWGAEVENAYIAEQLDYDPQQQQERAREQEACLNVGQRAAFEKIVNAVTNEEHKIFFIHGPGGTGKTFLYSTLCHKIRGEGLIVLCVASSGIAALLLEGGRTAHSMFKIPVESLSSESTCAIPKDSPYAAMLRRVRLIIWDEAANQHRWAPEAVDRTLRDLLNNDRPFGGITVVFGGDFQQILPVVVKGSREEIVEASLRRSHLWQYIEVIHLRQNMRLDRHEDNSHFAQWLLDIGHGRIHEPDNTSEVRLPDHMLRCSNIDSLIESVYDGVASDPPPPPDYFLNRTILSARNEDVDDLNQRVLDCLAGEEQVFYSVDSVILESGADQEPNLDYPAEYLRSLKASGIPLGELHLKIGCPVILLRNLAPSRGLCNGTRMIIRPLLPRIVLNPASNTTSFPFKLSRRQFPIRLAFAMSINKAQGQSVKHVGLDLRIPVFSHGQLYVALSRASSPRNIQALLPYDNLGTTTNIVYPEVLLD